MQMMDGVDSESSSSADLLAPPTDTRGKHRVLAELKRVEQEARFLEEELQKLETTEDVSTLCLELLQLIETKPDPLLPVTRGPANPAWDRWFEPPKDSEGCRCWIL
uniref:G protein gamma domain-containing protein n=2 Tax=Kalanchoe fedtschenkoi TaxID=63787 RepID=A0A7N0U249_KALFE